MRLEMALRSVVSWINLFPDSGFPDFVSRTELSIHISVHYNFNLCCFFTIRRYCNIFTFVGLNSRYV